MSDSDSGYASSDVGDSDSVGAHEQTSSFDPHI
jgi:hypothetical protein